MVIINNELLSFDYLIKVNQNYYNILKNDYYSMWKKKINFFEQYYYDYYKMDEYDFQYYNGLSYNALYIVRNINNQNLTYSISFNRFNNINTVYDLENGANREYGPIINSLVEFIKHEFFYNHKEVDYMKIFSIHLTSDDYYYLVARLLFPTYYYDLFKNNNIKGSYSNIISTINDYISYIKRIIIEIKKRHYNMSFLNTIINLL